MYNKHKKTVILWSCIFILCFLLNTFFSLSYYKADAVTFQNLDNEHMAARYAPSKNGKGVIIATDLAHDKSELSSLVYELNRLGYGFYVFDFPSQGESGANVPFHLNKSNYLAEQFYCALVTYSQIEDIAQKDIHIIGYGTGARAVLQTASMGFIKPESLTLIGTDISLTPKIQYNVLNFTKDGELSWVQDLDQTKPGCDIHLIASYLDNVSRVKDNTALETKLNTAPNNGDRENQNTVTLTKIFHSVHYMLIHDITVTIKTVRHIAQLDSLKYTPGYILYLRLPLIVMMFVSIVMIIKHLLYMTRIQSFTQKSFYIKKHALPLHFYRNKLLMWIAAVFVMLLLPIALYMIPINFPYNDIMRFSIFASYGLVMAVLYKFTDFGDNLGKYIYTRHSGTNIRGGLAFFLLAVIAISLIAFSGMYRLFSYQSKYIWVAIFFVFSALSFYIDERERMILARTRNEHLKIMLINFLFLPVAFVIFCVLGMLNTSFMVLLMSVFLIFVFYFERFLQAIHSPTILNALIKAFVFQTLVFAQCTMFFH